MRAPEARDRREHPDRALLRDSTTRRLLLLGGHEVHAPRYLFEELDAHWREIAARSGLPPPRLRDALRILRAHVIEHDLADYGPHLETAEALLRDVDVKDGPYAALALAIAADGIWTEDRGLKTSVSLRVFRTAELTRPSPRRPDDAAQPS